jgi:hypothetical protein
MRKITIYDYIASSVPADAYSLLKANGYPKPQNHHDLVAELKDYVRKNKETALIEIANIHPDKELIVETLETNDSSSSESKANDNSISEPKSSYMNATGDATNIPQSTQETINMSKLMIYGSFVLIGLALVLKTSNK